MKDLRTGTRDLDGGVTVLDLEGSLDKRTVPDLEKVMTALVDRGRLRLVVNCEKLSHLSSDGMTFFLSKLIMVRKNGGDIKFCNMREDARVTVSYLGVAKLLAIRETEREAVSEYTKKAEPVAPKEPEKLRIEVEDVGAVSVVVLHGFIDRHTIELLDKTLRELFGSRKAKIVVDCAELTYISSNGMGVFISYVNKARGLGGDIRFCRMRDIAKTVITMLGLHRLFEVFDTREAAVESFSRPAAK